MNNNDPKHPAQTPSGPNKYLQLARQTKCPLAIHFNDGEVIQSCIIMELDGFNLLIKTLDLSAATVGEEMVISRSSVKKITPSLVKSRLAAHEARAPRTSVLKT
jgi:hypothetical protein